MRLALREWKQRILIVLLIAVASAATLLGIAVASATPGTPNAGTFGTASTLIGLPGDTPNLPSVIAKIEKAYGAASVVDDEPIITGQAGGADLRAQDPSAPYTQVLLALDSGHYPSGPGQVAVTSGFTHESAIAAMEANDLGLLKKDPAAEPWSPSGQPLRMGGAGASGPTVDAPAAPGQGPAKPPAAKPPAAKPPRSSTSYISLALPSA